MRRLDDPLSPLIDQLHKDGRLRVWSLVITIFGDAIQPRGGRVSTARLQEILERMRIEPGALRTALSRLAKEGWVIREREGRRSFYRLSSKGIAEFEPATRRIYAPVQIDAGKDWILGLAVDRSARAKIEVDVLASQGLVLGVGGFLWQANEAPDPEWLRKRGILTVTGQLNDVPPAFKLAVAPEALRSAYQKLMTDFSDLEAADLAPLDAFVARILLVHHWRRIVLRAPELPIALQPKDWPAAKGRGFVAQLYRDLVAVSEPWLDRPVAGGMTTLPPPDTSFSRRFS